MWNSPVEEAVVAIARPADDSFCYGVLQRAWVNELIVDFDKSHARQISLNLKKPDVRKTGHKTYQNKPKPEMQMIPIVVIFK